MRLEHVNNTLLTAVLVALFGVAGCGYDGPEITVQELNATLGDSERETTVIDVRPKNQFEKGHVPGARNYPLEVLPQESERIASLKGDVAIICTCGRRSLAAVKQLATKGIKSILVEGGMKKWEAAGYPVTKEN